MNDACIITYSHEVFLFHSGTGDGENSCNEKSPIMA